MSEISKYFNTAAISQVVRDGQHRLAIGGMWDEIGALQLSFLRGQGLERDSSLLDIGCGSLRGGVRFVDYLEAGRYFGLDINRSLLEVGYDVELANAGTQDKLPRANLLCSESFEVERFERSFDFALAFSVFTHVTLNHIRVCLERLVPCMSSGGAFFATYFEIPTDHPIHRPRTHSTGGITSYGMRDPYHYRFDDIAWAGEGIGWEVEKVHDFHHPRMQAMARFTPKA